MINPGMSVPVVIFYSEPEQAAKLSDAIQNLQTEIPYHIVKIDINSEPIFKKNLQDRVPVLEAGPYRLRSPYNMQEFASALQDAYSLQLRQIENKHSVKVYHDSRVTKFDRILLWSGKNYMVLLSLIVFLYVGIPFLSPVFLKFGMSKPAQFIYTIYKPFCHQLAYRSWFLFGEQAFYPRALADIEGVKSYEEVTGQDSHDLNAGRAVIGSPSMGYKVALCERDVGIYGGILLFGLIFWITGRRLKSLPWYFWVIFGLIPLGLDGSSQLPGLLDIHLPVIFLRESTPLLRTITGLLFGISTGWYLYPMIEDGVEDTIYVLSRKIAIENQMTKNRIQDTEHVCAVR